MIRISRKGDYAVFILGYLAQRGAFPHPASEPAAGGGAPAAASTSTAPTLCSAHEISEQTKLQRSIVANLLKELTRAGILHSERGIRGGYRLASEPDQISLGQILRIIEGPLTLVDCTHDAPAARVPGAAQGDGRCRLEGHCPSRSPMRFLHERIQRLIDEIRLPELCGLRAPAVVAGRDPNSPMRAS
jgi:Rrf2 family protein